MNTLAAFTSEIDTAQRKLSNLEDRALTLLGEGISAEQTASALGVSASAISQLLSKEDFSQAVVAKRYATLLKQTQRDREYDTIEDVLLGKLKVSLGMIFDPMKLARLIQVVNAAKRRGAASDANMAGTNNPVVTLSMPVSIINSYTTVTNIQNQVVAVRGQSGSEAKDQSLVTIQSGSLAALSKAKTASAESLLEGPKDGHEQISRGGT